MKKNLSTIKIAVATLGIFFSTFANAQFAAVMSGDWSNSATWGGTAPTPTVTGQNITIPNGITVNLDADITFTGVLNTFMVNGTLNSTTTNWIHVTSANLSGTGTIAVNKLKVSGLSTITFAGTMNLKSMSNSVSTLAFTSVANVSDTLDLESGTINLNTNGNLTMMAGSTVKVKDGDLSVNSGVFNSGNSYNVMYVGTSKSAGVELNTVTLQNLYLRMDNNNQTVTLGNNTTINGNMDITNGKLKLNTKKLTLKGDIMMASGSSIDSDNAASLDIQGSGATTGNLMFSSGNSISSITVNRASAGLVKLGSGITISNSLTLLEGNLSIEAGGTLSMGLLSKFRIEKGSVTLNSGTFSGLNSYNVEYMGTTDITSGTELSGSGLNKLTVNMISPSNKVILNSNATLAAELEMMKGKLDLNGKTLMLNSTLSQNSSASFIGSSTSELHLNLNSVTGDSLYFDGTDAASQTLGKLKINTSGANSIVLASKLIINSELSFLQGKLQLGNGDLEIKPSATITGYDDTKYVVTSENGSGVLIQNVTAGSAYVTFPVGLSTNYSPAYVQQTATGTTGNFSAKCHSLVASATLKTVNRMWMVESMGVTTVNTNLKFGWKAASEVNSFDRTNAYVSHLSNNVWDVTATGSASAGVNSTFELERTGLTSLSPFAVVEGGQPLRVSELSKLANIELYPNPSKESITIKVATSGDYQYELIDITGKTITTTTNNGPLTKLDLTNLGAGCYFIKVTHLNENKTATKRFVKQ